MKTLRLSTNLIGVDGLFCTYWGAGKSEYTLHEDSLLEDFEEGYTDIHPDYYYMHLDNKKYMKDWNERVFDLIEEKLKESFDQIGIEVTLEEKGYSSPREYNFSHDVTNFDIEAESFDALIKYCKEHEDFAKFLKDHYSSCDGFMSFTANNVDEWEEDIQADESTAWGAAIRFLIISDDTVEELGTDCHYAFEDMYYSNYVDCTVLDEWLEDLKNGYADVDGEWQEALFSRDIANHGAVKKLVDDNYTTKTAQEVVLLVEKALEINVEQDILLSTVQKMYEEKAEHTLKLEL